MGERAALLADAAARADSAARWRAEAERMGSAGVHLLSPEDAHAAGVAQGRAEARAEALEREAEWLRERAEALDLPAGVW